MELFFIDSKNGLSLINIFIKYKVEQTPIVVKLEKRESQAKIIINIGIVNINIIQHNKNYIDK
jgi:hypothetical protein